MIRVMGPLAVISISMWAPNRPVSTGIPVSYTHLPLDLILDGFPVVEDFLGAADRHIAKDVGVADDEFFADVVDHIAEVEGPGLLLHPGVKHHLEQDVPQLLPKKDGVVFVDGLHGLVGLLNNCLLYTSVECYKLARGYGFEAINMDLIAGLPTDTPEGFRRSLDRAIRLGPENITVHALSVTRAADLFAEMDGSEDYSAVQAMVCLLYTSVKNIKNDLAVDDVFVFTPKGDVKRCV